MADLTVPILLTRINAINETITLPAGTLTAFRYWPRELRTAALPAIITVLGSGVHDKTTYGGNTMATTRSIRLLVPVDSPNAGLLTETAQRNAEAVIDPILDTYRQLPYLALSGAELDGVINDGATITQDTGIDMMPNTEVLGVVFTLVIPVIKYQ